MTAQEYTEEYNKAGQEKNLHESDGWDDLDDDNFSPKSLLKYMEENPELLPALLFFKLSPGSLADFIDAKGGAEMYEWDHMDLLQDMMEIYKILDPEQKLLEVYNATVTVEALDNILAKIGCHIPANEMMTITRKPWKDGAVLYIGLDYALGLLIQIRQMKVHESYIRMLPGGDDTYFDYYPGDMFYMTAVMDWFLNDGPRMA